MLFAGSLLFVVAVGVRTGVGVSVYLPMAIAVGAVLAGMPLVYLVPGAGADDDDDGDRPP